jgi:hypothetical protein
MSNPMLGTLKAIREDLDRFERRVAADLEHIETALADILRDLDHIKTQVASRKVGRRGVHSSRRASKP